MGNMSMAPDANAAIKAKGHGTVTAIDKAAGTITLDHGPIPEAKWPAMTMAFKAAPSITDAVKVGDKVDFDLSLKGSDGEVLGFCGVSDGNIEMLFIAPQARGQGVGARLTTYAIEHQGATKVDVNEQNVQALGFYQHVGFAVVSRSPVDGQGKPYPLLHMELAGR